MQLGTVKRSPQDFVPGVKIRLNIVTLNPLALCMPV